MLSNKANFAKISQILLIILEISVKVKILIHKTMVAMFFTLFLKCAWLMLPGIFANMTPVLIKPWFKWMAVPVDCGLTFRGKPALGANKTVRGFVFGILVAMIATGFQTCLFCQYQGIRDISLINYGEHHFLLTGFLIGFGVLFGDSFKSFFKRRTGRKPGERFFPYDQLDSVIGALVFILFVYIPTWQVVAMLIGMSLFFHILIRNIGYYIGINKSRW